MEPQEVRIPAPEIKRAPFQLFKENMQKIRFAYFSFDADFILNRESKDLLDSITQEFYYRQHHKSRLFYDMKRFFYNLDYRMHPEKYPALIFPESLKLENLGLAVPGYPIDFNLFIGYFREFKTPTGLFFTNIFNRQILPVTPQIDNIRQIIRLAIESAKPKPPAEVTEESRAQSEATPNMNAFADLQNALNGDQKIPEAKALYLDIMEGHFRDLDILFSACVFIGELFTYAQKENLPQLKTGHLIGFTSGMNLYFEKLKKSVMEYGMAVITIDPENPLPLLKMVQNVQDILNNALVCFTLDLLSPVFAGINSKTELVDGKIQLTDLTPIKPTPFTRLMSFFFDRKEKKPSTAQKPVQPRSSVSNPILKPKENKILEERILDSTPYIELHTGLKKFTELLKTTLAPDLNDQGQVLNFKQGFDQFDTPDHSRIINFNKVVLSGKFLPGDTDEYAGSNEMVVRSTYWLYDRVASILRTYRFSKEGVLYEKASHFADDVKALFYPSHNEYNDIRTYGIFPQFKLNLKRIFNSRSQQTKFIALLNQLSEQMEIVSLAVIKEESRRALLNKDIPSINQ